MCSLKMKQYEPVLHTDHFCECTNCILALFKTDRGVGRGVMVKAMDCRIVVSEFVLHSRDYVHFRANTLTKGMNSLILQAMG